MIGKVLGMMLGIMSGIFQTKRQSKLTVQSIQNQHDWVIESILMIEVWIILGLLSTADTGIDEILCFAIY